MAEPKFNVRSLVYAWIVCAAVLIIGEGLLHTLPSRKLLAFDQHGYDLSEAMDYTTVRRVNLLEPSADMVIIGSSREREGFIVPEIKQALAGLGLGNLDVRNYSQANGRSPSQLALVQLMRSAHHMPRVLIYGVTPLQLSHVEEEHAFTSCLVPLTGILSSDVPLENYQRLKYLGNICLSTADDYLRTLWLRELIRAPENPVSTGPDDQTGSAKGRLTRRQLGHKREIAAHRERSLVAAPISQDELDAARTVMEPSMSASERRQYNRDCARRAIELAVQSGSEVIVVELPVSQRAQARYAKGSYENFIDFYDEACRNAGARFIRAEDLGVKMQDNEMFDENHMNWTGAEKFTRAFMTYLTQHSDLIASLGADGHAAR